MNEERIGATEYLDGMAARGRYTFSTVEFTDAVASSTASAHNILARLVRQGRIASPAKGFYVIVPPEYRSLGCLPAEQFIPSLFEWKGEAYYAGLLTAAQFYGAAHQRPQSFQVFVERSRRDIQCGRLRVSFIANKRTASLPTRSFNTPRGQLRVSTPEVTAIDLVGYADRAGGLDAVATVLNDLAEEIDPADLLRSAGEAPIVWVQRLGYLLDLVDHSEIANTLADLVKQKARNYTPLAPNRPKDEAVKSGRWKIYENAAIEVDE